MNKIYVKSQAELDAIPLDYDGIIYIEFGNIGTPAKVKNDYTRANFYAYGSATVEAYGSVTVYAWDLATVLAYGSVTVYAHDSVTVYAYNSTGVRAYNSATVHACDSASVYACDSASVRARDSATVKAYDFAQVLDRTVDHQVMAIGDARIVCYPKTIDDYIRHYAIESDGKTCRLFKAVHKRDGKYVSDFWQSLEYVIGETARADGLCTNVEADCGKGIHLAHLRHAIEFGKLWDDLAILELEAENDKIIVPLGGYGKVRVLEAKVIREVPRDEWSSIYG